MRDRRLFWVVVMWVWVVACLGLTMAALSHRRTWPRWTVWAPVAALAVGQVVLSKQIVRARKQGRREGE